MPNAAGVAMGAISALTSALPGLIAGYNDLTHAEELAIKS